MSWARAHRWLAIVLVGPLVVWSISGLLFHLKPGWGRAYEMLSAERDGSALRARELAAPGAIEAALGGGLATRLELFDSALGPLVRVATADGPELVDAVTARRRSPLSEADARALAVDAVARSPHRAAYGAPAEVRTDDRAVWVRFDGGPTVRVGRRDARLSQRGPDTERIDWLYRIHYMQWTGNAAVDRVLAVAALALIWAVLAPGLVLFVRRLRARRTSSD